MVVKKKDETEDLEELQDESEEDLENEDEDSEDNESEEEEPVKPTKKVVKKEETPTQPQITGQQLINAVIDLQGRVQAVEATLYRIKSV